MKRHYSKVWIYALLIVWGIMPAMSSMKAHAADSQNNFNSALNGITNYETGQEILPVPSVGVLAYGPNVANWDGWREESGGWTDQLFAGHHLAVRLGFIRGDFDAYTQTYKAEPVIKLEDSSEKLIYSYLRVGPGRNYTGGSLNISVEFNKQTVHIRNNKNPSEQATIQYSDLLAKWASFASDLCSDYLGKKYCFFSQSLFWDGVWRYGFVATTDTPLYYTTNLPQDFIELFKKEKGDTSLKPIAYSLALRLAFVLDPRQEYAWKIREMTSEEIVEAMLERSSVRAIPSSSLLPIIAEAKR